MPMQVPSMAAYYEANPYPKGTDQAVAWISGATGEARTLGNDSPMDAAYVQGVTWRREWDHLNNPKPHQTPFTDIHEGKDLPIPAPGQVLTFPAPAPDAIPKNHKEVISTKTYGQDRGFSCVFRQWRASSHCRFLHGYALGFKFTFGARDFSPEGWVVDFGGLKTLEQKLRDTFDHKLLIARDDPWRDNLVKMNDGCAEVVIVPATGCEAFARMVYEMADVWLEQNGFKPRVRLISVEVSEHGANSAIAQG